MSTKLELKVGIKEDIKKQMEEYQASRKAKQPIQFPSAGSVFKRGDGFITAELIDKCGLKGYHVGNAFVSELHSGFIVNKGGTTAKEVLLLIDHVKKVVYERFGKKLELEIEVLGEDI